MLTSYLIIVVSVPVVGFISALKHGAFSLTLRKLPHLTPSARCASVLEGGDLMWTPGNQSPAIGR
jgi:hypothetical protein